jgi:hypothetical protein
MKRIKPLLISFVLLFMFYAAFIYKSDEIKIDGTWTATKVILDNEQFFPAKNKEEEFFKIDTKITISQLKDSMYIIDRNETLKAHFIIEKNKDGKILARLKSNHEALSGVYKVTIDTIEINNMIDRFEVQLKSETSEINFQKKLIYKPWKPEFPRKGQV